MWSGPAWLLVRGNYSQRRRPCRIAETLWRLSLPQLSRAGCAERTPSPRQLMKTSAKLLFGVGLLLLLGATGAGQMLPPPHPVSDFNVQILNLLPNKFVAPIPADGQHGGVYDYIRLRLIPDWKPSAAVPAAATVLKVEFWLEQTSVRVEVQAYFGEMPPSPRPPEME